MVDKRHNIIIVIDCEQDKKKQYYQFIKIEMTNKWNVECNKSGAFKLNPQYQDNQAIILIICLNFLLCGIMIVCIIRLCSRAFSYSNFHLLESYKFCTLGFVTAFFMILARFCQLELTNFKQSQLDDIQLYHYQGMVILNSVLTASSIFMINQTYTQNGFTWLLVAMNLDVSEEKQIQDDDPHKKKMRKKLKIVNIFRTLVEYLLMPINAFISILLLPMLEDYCQASESLIVFSTFLSVLIICIPLGILLKKRYGDFQTSKITKILWIYLILAITFRLVFLNYLLFQGFHHSQPQITGYLLALYSACCVIGPMLAMLFLSEKQLAKENSALLKRESGMIFGSVFM